MTKLKKRILDISYKHKLSHIGSCLTAVDIIEEIYKTKKEEDIFVLSCGHAGLALYVILENIYGLDAEELFKKHGVHPNKCIEDKIYCSSGSLGHGLPIAIGMALANKERKIYCLISDGELAEGSIWESLRFINEQQINNIEIYVNINGYSAYKKVNVDWSCKSLTVFMCNCLKQLHIKHTHVEQLSFLKGIDAHYYVMKKEDL